MNIVKLSFISLEIVCLVMILIINFGSVNFTCTESEVKVLIAFLALFAVLFQGIQDGIKWNKEENMLCEE